MSNNFCPTCEMLMEPTQEVDTKSGISNLVLKCPDCGTIRKDRVQNIIRTHELNKRVDQYNRINQNIVNDPSRYRTNKIKCINDKCISNTDEDTESHIVMFHYNEDKRLGYLCYHCHSAFIAK